jgi:capsular polysaccharide transport system ATP-binding protein
MSETLGCVRFDRVTKVEGRKTTNSRLLLDEASAEFPADRSTGILSMNATSLMALVRLITGATLPTRGRISRDCSVSFPLAHTGALSRNLSGIQNISFLAEVYGVDADDVIAFVRDFSGLGDKLRQKISTYKPDDSTRFTVSISYAFPFDIYVADRKLLGGAPTFREKCRAYIQDLREHAGMIVATTQPQVVRQFCDRVYVLDGQKLILFEKVGEGIRHFAPRRTAFFAGEDVESEDARENWLDDKRLENDFDDI